VVDAGRGEQPPDARGQAGDSLAAQPIHGQASPSADDFKSASNALSQVVGAIAGLVSLLAVTGLIWGITGEGYAKTVFIFVGGLVFALGTVILQGRASFAAAAERDFGRDSMEFVFDDHGYRFRSPGREMRFAWSTLNRYVETKNVFLIYFATYAVSLVPKRAFTADDLARLGTELRARIQPRKVPASRAKLVVTWIVAIVAFVATWRWLGASLPP
jgi:hypothetical protein